MLPPDISDLLQRVLLELVEELKQASVPATLIARVLNQNLAAYAEELTPLRSALEKGYPYESFA